MSGVYGNPRASATVDGLVELYSTMDKHDHLSTSSSRRSPLRLRNSGGVDDAVEHSDRQKVAGAKKAVYKALKDHIGKEAADKIFEDRNIKIYQGRGLFKSSRPDGQKITKDELGIILVAAQEEKFKQSLAALKPPQRMELVRKADRALRRSHLPNDPEVGCLFEMSALADRGWENVNFLRKAARFQKGLNKLRALRLREGQDARQQRKEEKRLRLIAMELLSMSGYMNFPGNVGGELRNAARQYIGNDFENANRKVLQKKAKQLTAKDLKALGALFERGSGSLTSVLNDLKGKFKIKISAERFIDAHPNKKGSLEELRSLRQKMDDDDHLRLAGDTLYVRPNYRGRKWKYRKMFSWNHAKSHFWGGTRSEKFKEAKKFVQRRLVEHYEKQGDVNPEETAKERMAKYMKDDRALTKDDLGKILLLTEM